MKLHQKNIGNIDSTHEHFLTRENTYRSQMRLTNIYKKKWDQRKCSTSEIHQLKFDWKQKSCRNGGVCWIAVNTCLGDLYKGTRTGQQNFIRSFYQNSSESVQNWDDRFWCFCIDTHNNVHDLEFDLFFDVFTSYSIQALTL